MRVALVQTDSGNNKEVNFQNSLFWFDLALKDNPDIICFAENFLFWSNEDLNESETVFSNRILEFQNKAKKNNVNIILGSIPLKTKDPKRITNSTLVINREGNIIHQYDKIYMYNVVRKDYTKLESNVTIPGEKIGIFTIDDIKVGMGICVDLRYPEYFRQLVKEGVELIFLPSNFRKTTGQLAWNILTIARAIENQLYFCACGLTGLKGIEERCGNSRIISFDGTIISEIKDEEGVIFADLNFDSLREFRKEFPVLKQMK